MIANALTVSQSRHPYARVTAYAATAELGACAEVPGATAIPGTNQSTPGLLGNRTRRGAVQRTPSADVAKTMPFVSQSGLNRQSPQAT